MICSEPLEQQLLDVVLAHRNKVQHLGAALDQVLLEPLFFCRYLTKAAVDVIGRESGLLEQDASVTVDEEALLHEVHITTLVEIIHTHFITVVEEHLG